ncbi:GNAT family N-acetyltransferase [uncultured Enterococcus sp.]|uniref:GNAT family N-acetyltransferase n=1 Tax=uncultured Enterococcus sp. TaxID=167972 RepID=UPI0025EBA27F|nr:GNAT family N-acetyltransferase [uncultured Enterococcus sp.]
MMESIDFRSYTPADLTSCAVGLVAAYKDAPWYNSWSNEDAKRRIETTMSGSNARGFILTDRHMILGMCLGRIDYYFDDWSQFVVDEFNIHPDSQKMGMGKRLMTYVSRELKQEHINRLFLMTGSSEVIPFYQKIGFSFNAESTMMTLDLS